MIRYNAVQAVFTRALKVGPRERCLIVTDPLKKQLAVPFYEYAFRHYRSSRLEVIPPLREHAEEPSPAVKECMCSCDVALLITTKSLSHTEARRHASQCGVRIASMPMITEDIMNRSLDVDYDALRATSLAVASLLERGTHIRVCTEAGTDIMLDRQDRTVYHNNGGIFDTPGAFGNLPEGEVTLAPVTANGVYVVDATFPLFGAVKQPITFTVEEGVVRSISGWRSREVIRALDAVGPGAYRVGEFAIGTNPAARIVGSVLEDEKVLGTCHIAVGNDVSYGGTNAVPLHLDGVMRKPTISVDGAVIMEHGCPVGWAQ